MYNMECKAANPSNAQLKTKIKTVLQSDAMMMAVRGAD